MSSPHFYQADKKFAEDVFGMNPNKELHQTSIDINPVGITTFLLKFRICTEFFVSLLSVLILLVSHLNLVAFSDFCKPVG